MGRITDFDYESAWAWETQPQGKGFSYFRLVFEQYRALRRLGLSIDICPTDTADFSQYKLVLVPGLMYWKGELRQKLSEYRGSVMIGPRSGSKTEHFSIPDDLPPDCQSLLNLKVSHVESLRPDGGLRLKQCGQVHHWYEQLEVGDDMEIVLSGEQGEAVFVRKENLHYLGAQLDATAYQQVMELLCQQAGIKTVRLPEGLRLRQLGDLFVAVNYAPTSVSLNGLLEDHEFDISDLPPAGVAFSHFEDA